MHSRYGTGMLLPMSEILTQEISRLERKASIYRANALHVRRGNRAYMTRLANAFQAQADAMKKKGVLQ